MERKVYRYLRRKTLLTFAFIIAVSFALDTEITEANRQALKTEITDLDALSCERSTLRTSGQGLPWDACKVSVLGESSNVAIADKEGDETNEAMCRQSTASSSFPGFVGGLECCGQDYDCDGANEDEKLSARCRDDLSDGAYHLPMASGGRCYQFNKNSAAEGQSYIFPNTGETETITVKGRISSPTGSGRNVAVLGVKRVKCTASTDTSTTAASCTTFQRTVCLDCSSVAGTMDMASFVRRRRRNLGTRRRGFLMDEDLERDITNEDLVLTYDNCVTQAFEDGFVKPAFILENHSGNSGVADNAKDLCVAWSQIF